MTTLAKLAFVFGLRVLAVLAVSLVVMYPAYLPHNRSAALQKYRLRSGDYEEATCSVVLRVALAWRAILVYLAATGGAWMTLASVGR